MVQHEKGNKEEVEVYKKCEVLTMGSKKDGKTTRKKDKVKQRKKKVVKRVVRPTSSNKNNHNKNNKDVELYCVCRQPWDGNSLMVQCDQCQDWFHPKCVGVSTKEAKDNPFICPSCQDKPILKLINYKMGSYTSKMQLSYYESIDPKRLYQLYSIPEINKYQQKQSIPNLSSSQTIIEQIIPPNHLQQIQDKIINDMENNPNNVSQSQFNRNFYNELILFISEKKDQVLSMIILFFIFIFFSYPCTQHFVLLRFIFVI